jgi:hypothetical protein
MSQNQTEQKTIPPITQQRYLELVEVALDTIAQFEEKVKPTGAELVIAFWAATVAKAYKEMEAEGWL